MTRWADFDFFHDALLSSLFGLLLLYVRVCA